MRKTAFLLALLLGNFPAEAANRYTMRLSLVRSFAGALMIGQINSTGSDQLLSVWSSVGRGRLLKCSPRCVTVRSLPLQNVLYINNKGTYRIALGGNFRKGQQIKIALRFQSNQLATYTATVQ